MSKKNHDPRHVARALALQSLFTELTPNQTTVETQELLKELDVTKYSEDLYSKIISGVKACYSELDPIIQILAPAWPLEQIAPVDRTLLRMGIWEAFVAELTPAKVVINEMIELGREFGGENSSPFINGVLGSLLNEEHGELITKLKNMNK